MKWIKQANDGSCSRKVDVIFDNQLFRLSDHSVIIGRDFPLFKELCSGQKKAPEPKKPRGSDDRRPNPFEHNSDASAIEGTTKENV